MKKALLVAFLGAVCLVLLAVVGLGLLASSFDPNTYKAGIAEAMEKTTGRELRFHSDLEMVFFPEPGLKTGRLTLHDPGNFGSGPFLSAESASLSVALQPLLSGVLEAEDLTLRGVALKLVTDTAGLHNWEHGFVAARRASADDSGGREAAFAGDRPGFYPLDPVVPARDPQDGPASPVERGFDTGPEREPAAVPLFSASGASDAEKREAKEKFVFRPRRISCADFRFVYRDLRRGASYTGTLAPFTVDDARKYPPLRLALAGSLKQDNANIQAEFELDARVTTNRGALRIDLEEAGVRLGGIMDSAMAFQGRGAVEYEQGSDRKLTLSDWSGSLGLVAPAPAGQPGLRLSLKRPEPGCTLVNTEFTNGRLEFTPPRGLAPAVYRGGLDIKTLDLDAFLAEAVPAAQPEPGESVRGAPNMTRPTVGTARLSPQLTRSLADLNAAKVERDANPAPADAALAEETLRAAGHSDIDMNLSFGTLLVKRLPLREARFELRRSGLKTDVPFTFKIFDGISTGSASLDQEQETPVLALSSTLNGLDMEEATRSLSDKFTVTGRCNASLELRGSGNAWSEMVHSLAGKAAIQVTRGEVSGFALIPSDLSGLEPVPEHFSFERISAKAEIEQGVASSRDIVFTSGVLSGKGGGKAHLAFGQMDLGIDFMPAGRPPAVPVNISGPYGSLSYGVDMRTFLRNVAETTREFR